MRTTVKKNANWTMLSATEDGACYEGAENIEMCCNYLNCGAHKQVVFDHLL